MNKASGLAPVAAADNFAPAMRPGRSFSVALSSEPAPMSSRDPIPTLRQRLSSARVELALVGVAGRLTAALWQWLLLAAAVVVVDALWPLPPWLRLGLGLVLLAGAARLIWRCIPPRAIRHASPARLAREIEQRCSLRHNPLISAVQLQVAPSLAAPADVGALLRARTSEQGEAAARGTESRRLTATAARRRSLLALLGALAFIVAAGLTAPRPVAAVALRLIDPFGDHPPYTPLVFDISFEPQCDEVVYGDSAAIQVRITGGEPASADLVCRDLDDRAAEPVRLPLQPGDADASEQCFTGTLRDCREPVQVMIDTPRGRSEWIAITPRLEPRWESRTLIIRGPTYGSALDLRRLPLGEKPEPIRVLQASHLTLEATSTLPLSALRATGQGASDGLVSQDAHAATWNWDAAAVGVHEIALRLIGPTGLASTPTPLRIEVVADAPPQVSIAQPPPRAAALADQRFTAQVQASDDLGVSQVELTAQVWREGELIAQAPQPLDAPQESGGRSAAAAEIDLSQLELQPGDTVRLQATAADNRPDEFGGPQNSAAAACDILIIDEATYSACSGGSAQAGSGASPSSASGAGASEGQGGGESAGAQSDADAAGEAPGGSGAPDAQSGESDAGGEGQQPGQGASGDSPAQSGTPGLGQGQNANPDSPTGGAAAMTSGETSASSALLDEARSRSLINRDGAAEPVAGRSDPDSPRRHLTELDDPAAPPEIAASRSTVRSQQAQQSEPGEALGTIPARYRDLAARYFRRLASQQAASDTKETIDEP